MMSTSAVPWLTGYIPGLPTPFDQAGRIDVSAFARLCERQIAAGVSAIVVCETAGEASTLSPAEQEFIIRAAVDVARGRVRIIAGAGSNSTEQAVRLTRRAEAAGVDAVLSVVPYYNKPMQSGIFAHFQAVSLSTGLPVILHDIPSRSVRELADETLARLCQSNRFAGLLDGTGDATRPIRLSALVPSGFRLLSGDDLTALAYIAAGGDGCISTIANITPGVCRAVSSSLRQGRLSAARHLERRLLTLEACLIRQNPAALKYALSLLGLMDPAPRLPLVEIDEVAKAEVARALSGMAEDDLAATAQAW
jgi:4-hydroxy-tetrahydrodipicolinate synthase